MISITELKRRLENIVQIGTVSETKSAEGKALARVALDDNGEDKRVSAFLPVLSVANSFMRVFIPIRVGEQVLVISPFGNANRGFIIRSIFNRGYKEPTGASKDRAVIEFSDGTVIYYDTKNKELKIDAVNDINIFCQSATVTADTVDITADVSIDGTLHVTGEISCDSEISDVIGDLTNHSHSDSDGATSLPR